MKKEIKTDEEIKNQIIDLANKCLESKDYKEIELLTKELWSVTDSDTIERISNTLAKDFRLELKRHLSTYHRFGNKWYYITTSGHIVSVEYEEAFFTPEEAYEVLKQKILFLTEEEDTVLIDMYLKPIKDIVFGNSEKIMPSVISKLENDEPKLMELFREKQNSLII